MKVGLAYGEGAENMFHRRGVRDCLLFLISMTDTSAFEFDFACMKEFLIQFLSYFFAEGKMTVWPKWPFSSQVGHFSNQTGNSSKQS